MKQRATAERLLCSDQAWQVAHPPIRGRLCNFTRPQVHRGFLSSWRSGGFNERIVEHIRGLIAADGLDVSLMRCVVTGTGYVPRSFVAMAMSVTPHAPLAYMEMGPNTASLQAQSTERH